MKELQQDTLDAVVERIAHAVAPQRIYLYGSHCYGTPDEDSDVDLLIVGPGDHRRTEKRQVAVDAYRALSGMQFPAEIKVVTDQQFEERSSWLSTIERVVKQKGIDLLIKELGPLEATRFMNVPRQKKVGGVKRHRQWQEKLGKKEFFDAVFDEKDVS